MAGPIHQGLARDMGLLTFVATAMVLPQVDWSSFSLGFPEAARDAASITFVVALAGRDAGAHGYQHLEFHLVPGQALGNRRAATAEEDRMDFHVGFALCVVLALCF